MPVAETEAEFQTLGMEWAVKSLPEVGDSGQSRGQQALSSG